MIQSFLLPGFIVIHPHLAEVFWWTRKKRPKNVANIVNQMAGLRLVQGGEIFNLTKCMLHAWYIGSYLGECMLPNTREPSTRFFLLRVWYYVIFRGLLRRSTTSVFPDFHPGKVPFSATNGCSFDKQAWMMFPSKRKKSSKPVQVMRFLSHYFSNLAAPPGEFHDFIARCAKPSSAMVVGQIQRLDGNLPQHMAGLVEVVLFKLAIYFVEDSIWKGMVFPWVFFSE